jgi:regulatory protein
VTSVLSRLPSVLSLLFLFSPLVTRHFLLYASLVFPKPRQIDTEPALYDAAIKILMRRARSVSEMKKALIRRTADEDLIQKVIARLKQNGYIDDARYAKQFARQRTEIRKQGKFRVARELRARGVPDRHITPALEAAASDTDEAAVVRQRIQRKLKLLRGEIDDRKVASLYRSLLRAGFSSDTIRRELRRLTDNDLPDADPAEADEG